MKRRIIATSLVALASLVSLGAALAPAAAAMPTTTWTLQECYRVKPVLRPRSNNHHPCVIEVQKLLATPITGNPRGYDPGPIDGIYGPKTKAAVKRFQQDFNQNMAPQCGLPKLTVDGIVGKYTWRAFKNCAYGTND